MPNKTKQCVSNSDATKENAIITTMLSRFNVKLLLIVKVSIICCSFFSTSSTEYGSPHTGEMADKDDTVEKPNHVFSPWMVYIQVDDLSDLNCTVPAIVRFPRTLFSEEQREKGAVIVNFLFAIYLFGCLAYVCSVYFVPSLEIISKTLGIQEDVAGATFMAIGSSAPELFSSAIGTFVTYDNTGLSAIIGSAAFNVFIIIALCALFAGGKNGLQLLWYPVIRDFICWVISVIILIAVTADGLVKWWEGLIMTLGFFGYIFIMAYNKPVSKFILAWSARTNWLPCGTMNQHEEHNVEELSLIDARTSEDDGKAPENIDDEAVLPSVFNAPESTALYVAWLLGLPIILLLHCTVPDCRMTGLRRRCYPLTFIMSTLWLALLSYLLYWMVEIIGYTLGISDVIMGYTVLAIGTSVPDAIASVLVARDGFADMAVANIIGSNIFETYICLGMIWFLKSVTSDPAGSPVSITEDGLTVTSVCLIFMVSFVIVAIHNNSWRLDLKIGLIAILFYIVFIALTTLNAEGVFGTIFQGNVVQPKPACPPSLFGL